MSESPYLRDKLIELFNPPNKDESGEDALVKHMECVAEFIEEQACECYGCIPCERCFCIGRIGNIKIKR